MTLFQVLSDVDVNVLIQLIKMFGMEFRTALIFDRIKEELRNFCANHTIDEVLHLTIDDFILLDVASCVDKNLAEKCKSSGVSLQCEYGRRTSIKKFHYSRPCQGYVAQPLS